MNEFDSVSGKVQWEIDSEGITVLYGKQRMRASWQEITRGGLAGYPSVMLPDNFPYGILPGLRRLVETRDNLVKNYLQLVLARGGSSFRAFRVPIPKGDANAKLFVDEVQRNLGERWAVGELPWNDYAKALGLRNPWWFYGVFVAVFFLFGLMLLLAAGAFSGLMSGRLGEVPVIGWIGLFMWVGLVVWLLVKVRALWPRRESGDSENADGS